MKAVIFKGPHKVEIEERPVPKIQDGKDIIVQVEYSALCGRYVFLYLIILSQIIVLQ
jgi:threonine dehydrogenase-like Zn-dependent dehydrogenase